MSRTKEAAAAIHDASTRDAAELARTGEKQLARAVQIVIDFIIQRTSRCVSGLRELRSSNDNY